MTSPPPEPQHPHLEPAPPAVNTSTYPLSSPSSPHPSPLSPLTSIPPPFLSPLPSLPSPPPSYPPLHLSISSLSAPTLFHLPILPHPPLQHSFSSSILPFHSTSLSFLPSSLPPLNRCHIRNQCHIRPNIPIQPTLPLLQTSIIPPKFSNPTSAPNTIRSRSYKPTSTYIHTYFHPQSSRNHPQDSSFRTNFKKKSQNIW